MNGAPTIQSSVLVNGVVWITSLEGDKIESTENILDDLIPFLDAREVPFWYFEPKSASELIAILKEVERAANENGFKPIIHFDTHGSRSRGIQIAESIEHVGWYSLRNLFRNINIATGNNLCIISMACHGLRFRTH